MYKFRSMRMNADDLLPTLAGLNEAAAPLFKIRDDPRKTRVGRVLRRLSIDELPQLFNVLKGDLSLVGPRPPLASELQEYEPAHWQRLAVPQGITGLWQVSGRSLLNFDEMLELDIKYVRSWSLGVDLLVLIRTIPTVLSGKGAF
jgi:lipopolysaccharide/colanic/teichoic acid biosynthesis glycosyltransferase